MKKMITLMLALVMLACAMTALASEGLNFTQRSFYGGQTLAVYQGPGEEYQRGANGWAKASTDEALYAAGKENGWALVMYPTGKGSTRVGWVKLSQFKYNTNILKLEELDFEYSDAFIAKDCVLTDDPVLASREITVLSAGTRVGYLTSFYKYRSWAYIETWVEDHPVRAFVPMDCLRFN